MKDMGLVSQVFSERDLHSLQGDLAVGHVRYSTTGSTFWENAQPIQVPWRQGSLIVAHNGNLINTEDAARGAAGARATTSAPPPTPRSSR